jgi:3-methyladenine DNA glycosylase AlkC
MPFADELIGAATVAGLAKRLSIAAPDRSWSAVRTSGKAKTLAGLGLSERARAIRDALLSDGPADYGEFEALIRTALRDPAFTGWMIWPVSEAVATLATQPGDRGQRFEAGLQLLSALTPELTGEFALRTFLIADLDRTLTVVKRWTTHPNEHVRRLASEGTRPRLPWARRVPELTAAPQKTVPVLDRLYRDDAEYVRRSVANHLNDLSRADPELAVRTAARWSRKPDANTARLVRHAMRTLIKQADPGALALLGFEAPAGLLIEGPSLEEFQVSTGGAITFAVAVTNPSGEPVRVAIDYVVHYQKSNGTLAPKVFKLATRTLGPGERFEAVRRQSFAPITTRRHYPGEHAIELQVNGVAYGRTRFALEATMQSAARPASGSSPPE